VFKKITHAIVSQLERGEIPWQSPWTTNGPPRNLVSGRPYRGINVFILGSKGRVSPYWLSAGGLRKLGGTLKIGEVPSQVVLWSWRLVTGKENAGRKNPYPSWVPFFWGHEIFNTDQCTGIKVPDIYKRAFNPIKRCEQVAGAMPKRPVIKNGVPHAFYDPLFDQVNMPNPELFSSTEGYYSTLFHELVHATGHHSRLHRHRQLPNGFQRDDHDYSKEELVAEFGAALLCAQARISMRTIRNSRAYIQEWLSLLENDRTFLFYAALNAQRAFDFICGTPSTAGPPWSGSGLQTTAPD